jgi:hypothetical protein
MALGEEGSSSFLKKRTKKLLCPAPVARLDRSAGGGSKSFLLLFFKKEVLPSLPLILHPRNREARIPFYARRRAIRPPLV